MGRRSTKAQRPTKSALNMSEEETLLALETLARTLAIEVRYEKGDFFGGLCRIDDKSVLLLQKADPAYRKIAILARELGTCNLDDIFVVPALRSLIEAEASSGQSGESNPGRN